MNQNALKTFSVTRHGVDPRADDARRIVHINATHVSIERVLQGVRMRIGVPVGAYRALVIAINAPNGNATLTLRHDDHELDVMLASGEAIEIAQKAKAWNAVLGTAIVIEEACVAMLKTIARRTKRAAPSRRSRFARRRAMGSAVRLATSFAGEREIIART